MNQANESSFFYKLEKVTKFKTESMHILSGRKFMETVLLIEMVRPFSRAHFSDSVLWFLLDSIDSMRGIDMIHIVRFK